jgi:hypothetical protein
MADQRTSDQQCWHDFDNGGTCKKCGWPFEKQQRPSNPVLAEQLEILRRIAERGKRLALQSHLSGFVDVFQHLLDELQRVRTPDETPACRCVELGYTCPTCCAASVATACPPPAQMTSGEYLCPKCGYFHPPPDGD